MGVKLINSITIVHRQFAKNSTNIEEVDEVLEIDDS